MIAVSAVSSSPRTLFVIRRPLRVCLLPQPQVHPQCLTHRHLFKEGKLCGDSHPSRVISRYNAHFLVKTVASVSLFFSAIQTLLRKRRRRHGWPYWLQPVVLHFLGFGADTGVEEETNSLTWECDVMKAITAKNSAHKYLAWGHLIESESQGMKSSESWLNWRKDNTKMQRGGTWLHGPAAKMGSRRHSASVSSTHAC